MDVVVEREAVEEKPIGTVVLLIRGEVGEVVFDHLVRPFGLTIGRKVIHRRSSRGGSEMSEERGEGIGNKCSTVVGDESLGRAVVSIDFASEELGPDEALSNEIERDYSSQLSRRR